MLSLDSWRITILHQMNNEENKRLYLRKIYIIAILLLWDN